MRFITRKVFVVSDEEGVIQRVFSTQAAADAFRNGTHLFVDDHLVEFERETMIPEDFEHEVQG